MSAAAAGQVTYAGCLDSGYGVVVVIGHADGVRTRYAHLERGRSGAARASPPAPPSGASARLAPQPADLHFEVRIRGASVDPQPALGF